MARELATQLVHPRGAAIERGYSISGIRRLSRARSRGWRRSPFACRAIR